MINYETLKHVIRVLLITVLTLKVARFHPNSRISTIGITTKNINIVNNKKTEPIQCYIETSYMKYLFDLKVP